MRSIRQVGKSVKVIVEHPDGGLLSLPASETSLSLPEPCPKVLGKTPLFDPNKLRRLAEWVCTQNTAKTKSQQPAAGETSLCQQHEEVGISKIDATTAQNTPRRSQRTLRTHSALDKADGAVSEQNARPRTSGVHTQGEPN